MTRSAKKAVKLTKDNEFFLTTIKYTIQYHENQVRSSYKMLADDCDYYYKEKASDVINSNAQNLNSLLNQIEQEVMTIEALKLQLKELSLSLILDE